MKLTKLPNITNHCLNDIQSQKQIKNTTTLNNGTDHTLHPMTEPDTPPLSNILPSKDQIYGHWPFWRATVILNPMPRNGNSELLKV